MCSKLVVVAALAAVSYLTVCNLPFTLSAQSGDLPFAVDADQFVSRFCVSCAKRLISPGSCSSSSSRRKQVAKCQFEDIKKQWKMLRKNGEPSSVVAAAVAAKRTRRNYRCNLRWHS